MSTEMSRRRFFRTAAKAGIVVAAPMIVPASVLGQGGATPPSEKIILGAIGIGGRGSYILQCFLGEPDVRCVAVCDVQAQRRTAAKRAADTRNGNQECATYRDLRELLDRPDLDAVMIATGPNWHTTAACTAARAG